VTSHPLQDCRGLQRRFPDKDQLAPLLDNAVCNREWKDFILRSLKKRKIIHQIMEVIHYKIKCMKQVWFADHEVIHLTWQPRLLIKIRLRAMSLFQSFSVILLTKDRCRLQL
jgi:hypothetical protein